MIAIERAFLAAILAAPDDDTPRLVYADWLEENGHAERAEFIHVQCELTKEPAVCPVCHRGGEGTVLDISCWECEEHWPRLRRRERELFCPACFGGTVSWGRRVHYSLPSAPNTAKVYDVRLLYRRGFIEQVTCVAPDWLEYGPEVVATHPVREVRLKDKQPWPLNGRAWQWDPASIREEAAHVLRDDLWRCLPPIPGSNPDPDFWPTRDDALAALSAACLAWARSQLATPTGVRERDSTVS